MTLILSVSLKVNCSHTLTDSNSKPFNIYQEVRFSLQKVQSPFSLIPNLDLMSLQMLLFTHIRLAHGFSNHRKRLQAVQARLHAISILGKRITL